MLLKSKMFKRTFALVLCVVMALSMSSFAVGEVTDELLPLSIANILEEQGFNVSRTAEYELIATSANLRGRSSTNGEAQDYALRITDKAGSEVNVYDLIILSKNEDGEFVHDNEALSDLVPRWIGNPSDGGTFNIAGKITLIISTTYTTGTIQGVGSVYKPTAIAFRYSKDNTCNVSSISATLSSRGNGYSSLTTTTVSEYNYRHTIAKSASAPAAGTLYRQSNPCPYFLDLAPGGMFVDYNVTVDGVFNEGQC